ncbi:MAG: HDOD domain-containing protein [Spirochaetaceae bacterium]|nr:HDOD domain-containing protein [Spirochaetaceae bacterium]MBQ4553529.1 HDOD domain-containing protein [Spirochaetaceae bacterium]
MRDDKRVNIDVTKIRKAIQSGIPLSITTYTLPHEMEVYMGDVLTAFLSELNQSSMVEFLTYSLNELVTNAKKANTKRVYFAEKQLNINDLNDYNQGMVNFKQETLDNINHYLEIQKAKGLYVKLILQARPNEIKIEVRNNSELTAFEYKRIHDKIEKAHQYSSIEEAFSQVLDETEGAGLGLIIMILMLRKIGLDDDNYQVLCENGETINRIIIPTNKELKENLDTLSNQLVSMIDSLPQFPENIAQINSLLNDDNVKLSEIATLISSDVALSADLLKIVNSAAFSLQNSCHSIPDAVKFVGTRGIKNLLFSLGSIQNLGSSSSEQKKLWDHSYKVAFYSYNIAKNFFANDKLVVEDSYVCGLLHDMGKLIFDVAHPKILEEFEKSLQEKAISSIVLEKITAGQNHAEIGGLIAKKWNFPEVVTLTIQYHHYPEAAPTEIKKLATVVYFANMLANYQEQIVEYYQFNQSVLSIFGIETENQLKSISDKLNKVFNS